MAMASTFTIFNRLPYDIRYLIWSEALDCGHGPRLIRLTLCFDTSPENEHARDRFLFLAHPGRAIPSIPPSVISSCTEARAIAIAHFPDTAVIYQDRWWTIHPHMRSRLTHHPVWSSLNLRPHPLALRFNAARDFFHLAIQVRPLIPGQEPSGGFNTASLISRIQKVALFRINEEGFNEIGRILPLLPAFNEVSVICNFRETYHARQYPPPKAESNSIIQQIISSSWETERGIYGQSDPSLKQEGDAILSRLTFSLCRRTPRREEWDMGSGTLREGQEFIREQPLDGVALKALWQSFLKLPTVFDR